MIWANETNRKQGDLKVLYNHQTGSYNLIEANEDGDFVILNQSNNYKIVKKIYEEIKNEQRDNFKFMKVLISLQSLSEEAIIWICGEVKTTHQAVQIVDRLKGISNMEETEILKLTREITKT